MLHLIGPGGGLPGRLLETSDGVVETCEENTALVLGTFEGPCQTSAKEEFQKELTIGLALQRLHLLPNGIHVGCFPFLAPENRILRLWSLICEWQYSSYTTYRHLISQMLKNHFQSGWQIDRE